MYKATVNDKRVITLNPEKEGVYDVNGVKAVPDIVEIRDGVFHILLDNKSYNAELVNHDATEKTFWIKVNNNTYKIQVRDRYDELLHELGLDAAASRKAADLKAPMPGLVVDVAVTEGQHVKQGEKIIVLEAMKMENILKAPADVIIKKINVTKGNTVEKNTVLVHFQ